MYVEGKMAERQGFEPWVPFRVHTLSKRAPSATRPSLRIMRINNLVEIALRQNLLCDVLCDVAYH